mgnify:CR=1 FL=1
MLRIIWRLATLFLIILILFAILPQSFWNWLKPYFNIEVLINTLKAGWYNFWNFLKETTGLDLSKIPEFIKNYLGIDLIKLWLTIKTFLISILEKILNILR